MSESKQIYNSAFVNLCRLGKNADSLHEKNNL